MPTNSVTFHRYWRVVYHADPESAPCVSPEPLCALSSASTVTEKADSRVAISNIILSILFKHFLLSENS